MTQPGILAELLHFSSRPEQLVTDSKVVHRRVDTPAATNYKRVVTERGLEGLVPQRMGSIDVDVLSYIRWGKKLRGLADTTLRVRAEFLQRMHIYLDMPLRDVEPGHLMRFEAVAIAGRKPETMRSYVCHSRAFFKWMVDAGHMEYDPSVMLTMPKVPRHLPRPIAEDDLATALRAARPKMRAIITLGAYGGLRCCEIASLDWDDLQRDPDKSSFLHVRGKGSKDRTVEIGETVLRALAAYGIQRRGPIFLGLDGRRMTAGSMSGNGNRFLKRHGVEATMHQLRHRYGTVAYSLSNDLRMVQNQLGHASPTTTAGYTRVSRESAARMVAAMDELANPA